MQRKRESSGKLLQALGLSVALAALSGLSGCSKPTAEQEIESAKASIKELNPREAAIRLKSALQADPQSAEARYLLGQSLLQLGDYSGATIELTRAADLQFDRSVVIPSLIKAMVGSGQAKKATDTYSAQKIEPAEAMAELQIALATAYAAQGLEAQAATAVDSALKSNPKHLEARLLRARSRAKHGDLDAAIKIADELKVDRPGSREVMQLAGELEWFGRGNSVAGAAAFRKVLEIDSKYVPAHSALLAIYLQNKDASAFRSQFETLKKALPNHPETKFFDAQLALLNKEFPRARDLIQQLLKRGGADNPKILQLAGALEATNGSLMLADTYLSKAVLLEPNLVFARELLTETYLRRGQNEKALSTLKPALERPNRSAQTLALAAQIFLLLNEPAKADAMFAEGSKAAPGDSRFKTGAAIALLMKGQDKEGFEKLEALAQNDSSNIADVALINAYMRRNMQKEALETARRLVRKQPDNPLGNFHVGQILFRNGDLNGAETAFSGALKTDPKYFPATGSLATISMMRGKPAEALSRLEAALNQDPGNSQILAQVIQLMGQTGVPVADVGKKLRDFAQRYPADVVGRLLLIEHLLAVGDAKNSVDEAQKLAATMPSDPRVLTGLGRALRANGENQQAIANLTKAAALQANSWQIQLHLAEAYSAQRDLAGIERALKAALAISPSNPEVERAFVRLALAQKKPEFGLALARGVQQLHPKLSSGFFIEAELHSAQKNWPKAIQATKAAQALNPSSTFIASRLVALHSLAGQAAEADSLVRSWMTSHPGDSVFLATAGAVAIEQQDYAKAEARLRAASEIRAGDASTLNNLAWAMLRQNKPGAAAIARQAYDLAPNNPGIADTLVTALVAENQLPKALEIQRKTVEGLPNAPDLRLRYAELLGKSGNKSGATVELDRLEKLGDKYPRQAEVKALRAAL